MRGVITLERSSHGRRAWRVWSLVPANGRALRGRSIVCSFTITRTAPPPQLLTCPHDPQRSPQELPSGLRAASFGRHGSWVSRRPFFPSEDPSRVWSPEPTEFYMRSHHAFHLLCSVPARSLPPARQLKLHSLNRHTVPTHCRSPRGLAARVCTHTSVRGHACSLAHTQHTRTHGPHAHTQHCILQKRKPIVY